MKLNENFEIKRNCWSVLMCRTCFRIHENASIQHITFTYTKAKIWNGLTCVRDDDVVSLKNIVIYSSFWTIQCSTINENSYDSQSRRKKSIRADTWYASTNTHTHTLIRPSEQLLGLDGKCVTSWSCPHLVCERHQDFSWLFLYTHISHMMRY